MRGGVPGTPCKVAWAEEGGEGHGEGSDKVGIIVEVRVECFDHFEKEWSGDFSAVPDGCSPE